MIALLGSYLICREDEEDTEKALRLIPINETKLTAAKMLVTFVLAILLYLLLFAITFFTEVVLHFSDLSAELVFSVMKEYCLDGIGVFLAVSPVIALTARRKKGYWLALVCTEVYCAAGLFAGMSAALSALYPVYAVFNFSGYHITDVGKRTASVIVLLLCGGLSALLLKGLSRTKVKT